jgi:hypothetical protein
MIIYCDRLTFASCVAALRLRRRYGAVGLCLLDAGPSRLTRVLAWVLARSGLPVEEARFFAGHLRTADGESVYIAARRAATELSFASATQLLERAPRLASLNQRFGRNTIRLYLARRVWHALEAQVLRILVAQRLARPGAPACMLLAHPASFPPDCLQPPADGMPLHFYRGPVAPRVGSALRAFVLVALRPIWSRLRGGWLRVAGGTAAPASNPAAPGVLLLQEDDISLDHSYRTQPHWLFPDDPRPAFETYILQRRLSTRGTSETARLRQFGVVMVDPAALSGGWRRSRGHGLHWELRAAARRCLMASWGRQPSAVAGGLADTSLLLARAAELVPVCEHLGIRAFAFAESYLTDADAMHLLAPVLDIRTIAYQYSNLALPNPIMMTTADIMAVFSDLYREVWRHAGVGPEHVMATGYVFDRSFAKVRPRARGLRQRLEAAGASFVICYFDESVQHDRYGLVGVEDHRRELTALLRLVLDSQDIGLIVKTQFERNAPGRLYADEPLLHHAASTGRYVELTRGRHRNDVLPAEAALASDLAIGHSVGATAALEAALAGTRAVLLNPYGMRLLHDGLYQEADVLYDSMESVLAAVRAFRSGEPARRALGDWTPILPRFDPYRDGAAAVRFRRILESAVGVRPEGAEPIGSAPAGTRQPVLSTTP